MMMAFILHDASESYICAIQCDHALQTGLRNGDPLTIGIRGGHPWEFLIPIYFFLLFWGWGGRRIRIFDMWFPRLRYINNL